MRRGNQIKGSATAAKLPHSPAHDDGNTFWVTTAQLRDPNFMEMKRWHLSGHGSEAVIRKLTATSQSTTSTVDGQANQSKQ